MQTSCLFSCYALPLQFESKRSIHLIPLKKKSISTVNGKCIQRKGNASLLEFETNLSEEDLSLIKKQSEPQRMNGFFKTTFKEHTHSLAKISQQETINQEGNPQNLPSLPPPLKVRFGHRRAASNQEPRKNSERFIPQIIHELDEFQANKGSSLYGGAKLIIKKLQSTKQLQAYESPVKYLQAKMNEQNYVNIESPKLKTNRQMSEVLERRCIPKVSQSFSQLFDSLVIHESRETPISKLKLGKLLGKGKYSHSTLAIEQKSGFICAIKQIFKYSSSSEIFTHIMEQIKRQSELLHQNVANIYFASDNHDKIIILQEHFSKTLQEEMAQIKKLPLEAIQTYLREIIEAVAALHSHGIVHGNVCLEQINVNGSSCKLRPSFTHLIDLQQASFIDDLHGIVVSAYEMAYGLSIKLPNLPESEWKRQKKTQILLYLINNTEFFSQKQKRFDNLLLELLINESPQPELRPYLHHSFFQLN